MRFVDCTFDIRKKLPEASNLTGEVIALEQAMRDEVGRPLPHPQPPLGYIGIGRKVARLVSRRFATGKLYLMDCDFPVWNPRTTVLPFAPRVALPLLSFQSSGSSKNPRRLNSREHQPLVL